VPPIFALIQKSGGVPTAEMKKTFNMGIGFVMITGRSDAPKLLKILNNGGFPAWLIGRTVSGTGLVRYAKKG
jgi:phosphoribosylformylglycinamidine cyclo-ligase